MNPGQGDAAPPTPPARRATRNAVRAPGAPGAGAPVRWQASRLLAAPHRLGFFGGAVMFAASALWWTFVLCARAAQWPLPWAISPGLAHATLMTFGFMPLFFCGFLLTAGTKWLAQPELRASVLLPTVGPALAGWLLYLVGVHASASLAASGLTAVAAAWSAFALRWWRLLRTSRARDRTHPRWIAAACGVGVFALWSAAASIAWQREDFARAAVQIGLWGFVALVFVTAAHRMIPFFSDGGVARLDARRPAWLLWVFGATLAVQAAFGALGALGVPGAAPAPAASALRAAAEAPSALLLVGLALRWAWRPALRHHLRQRLLAMMYVGFAWFGAALALATLSDALEAAGGGRYTLGIAPLHAMTMGFLASILLAMASRVACGHSGRSLAADGFLWRVFWLLQIAVLLRLLSAAWPAAPQAVLVAAALAWAAVAVAWALRYGRWFGLPRVDGRPG